MGTNKKGKAYIVTPNINVIIQSFNHLSWGTTTYVLTVQS